MSLAEGQVSVRGLVMGPDTDYKVLEFNPWVRSVRADQSGARAWGHGSWSGAEWAEQAVVPILIETLTEDLTSWRRAQQHLAAAFAPIGDATADVELRWCLDGVEYLLRGRPRLVSPTIEHLRTGRIRSGCSFVAPDPTIYSGIEYASGDVYLPSVTGGIAPPLTPPLTITATVSSGTAHLVNAGTRATSLRLHIESGANALVSPRITVTGPDGAPLTLRLGLTLAAGDFLDIDTAARTVTLNGTADRRAYAVGDWPLLAGIPAGDYTSTEAASDITWMADVYSATARLSATWRYAWAG